MEIVVCTTPPVTAEEVHSSRLFVSWESRVKDWNIPRVTVADAFSWDGAIRMLLLRITYGAYDHAVLLRGATVDILTILTCGDRKFLVHVDQPRVAAGHVVRSNAAGMVDDDEAVTVAALRELAEELAINMEWGIPLNLNEAVYGINVPEVVTPGGSDEEVTFFAVHVQVSPAELAQLEGRTGGLAHEGERTVVHLTEFTGRVASVLPQLVVNRKQVDLKATHGALLYDEVIRLRGKSE